MIDIENVTVEQRRYKRKKNRKSPQSPPKFKKNQKTGNGQIMQVYIRHVPHKPF